MDSGYQGGGALGGSGHCNGLVSVGDSEYFVNGWENSEGAAPAPIWQRKRQIGTVPVTKIPSGPLSFSTRTQP